MGRSHILIRAERERSTRSPPVTCIVNDAHLGGAGVCGKPAAEKRECVEPVCADHLCQYRRSNGHRCKKLPLRLASHLIYTAAGWYPDTSESVYCKKHEKHNCMGFVSGTVRCSAAKIPGQAYCPAHAVVMCRWRGRDGSLCAEMAYPESRYCGGHCCAVENEAGYRCPEPRCRTTLFCSGHRCVWRADKHAQCENTWYPNTPGVCPRHVCVRNGCENRALDGMDRCPDHVCAFPPPDWPSGFPACYREPLEGQAYCELHDGYFRAVEQMMRDAQGSGRYG